VEHIVSVFQKRMNVEMSRVFLRALRIQAARSWHDIIAIDQPWVDVMTDYELLWLAQGQEAPERERSMVQSPKMTITVLCTPIGFHIIDIVLQGSKFNAHDHVSATM
jgi:hypothetical protein